MFVVWEIFKLTSSAFIFKLRSLHEEGRVFKCMKVREVLSIVSMIYGSALARQPALWYVFSYFRHSAPFHLFHCVLSESSFHYQAPPGVKNMSLYSFSLWIALNALVVAYITLEAHALTHLPESCSLCTRIVLSLHNFWAWYKRKQYIFYIAALGNHCVSYTSYTEFNTTALRYTTHKTVYSRRGNTSRWHFI